MSNRFAQNDDEAKSRYQIWKSKDPFPDIHPALLNSADISDYVAATGMVHPFDEEKLKPATYEITFDGKIYYWNEKGEDKSQPINIGEKFVLPKNSIAFISPKIQFRIPCYIALRFNLEITHVHRGILLGTGPLVDPGFEGRLLIPLHNLTSNDYEFTGGDGLIWTEFTKLSENRLWVNKDGGLDKAGEYVEFPLDKKNRPAEYYFGKAAPGRNIRSSIPEIILKSKKDAERAKELADKAAESAKKAEDTTKRTQFLLTLGGIIGLAALLLSLWSGFSQISKLVEDTNNFISGSTKDFNKLKNDELLRIENLEQEVRSLKEMLNKTNQSLDKSGKKEFKSKAQP